ncbi:MAG: hypothetical protein H0W11_14855 [Gemmatimonadetes bacterium]|nr:hypothetical protein [Gemmatimonadota bacterium]
MSASCVRAHAMRNGANGREALRMADVFCRRSRHQIDQLFGELFDNEDAATYKLAQSVLRGEHAWLEKGIQQVVGDAEAGKLAAGSGGRELRPLAGGRKLSGTRETTQIAAGG